jgi:hypothetical protein
MTELTSAPSVSTVGGVAGTMLLPTREGASAGLLKMTVDELAAYIGGGGGGAPWWFDPPLASAFTARSGDGTSPTMTDDADVGLIVDCGAAVNGDVSRCVTAPITSPSADWSAEFQLDCLNPSDNYNAAGVFLRNAATGKLYDFGQAQDRVTILTARPSLAGWSADVYTKNWSRVLFYKVTFTASSGTYSFYVSMNGKQYILAISVLIGAHFGAGNFADQIGFGAVTAFSSTVHLGVTCGRFVHSW